MSLMISMIKQREVLSISERAVLDYLIANKTILKDLSVESVAQGAFTSPASVVRMCKKLGYKGFKEFKVDFLLANSKIEIPNNKEYEDVILGKNLEISKGRRAIENNIKALEDTLKLYSDQSISKAAEIIMTSRKTLLFGKGSSYLACKDFQMKLRRIDKFCIAQEDSHEQLVDATFLDKRDVVVLISNSGETQEIIQAAIVAKENNAQIVSIVKAGKSFLAELSNITLYTSALEGDFRSAAMTSRISQMAIIDALFSTCAFYDLDRSVRKLERTYQTFKKYKNKTNNFSKKN
ncbi:MurR/RpiR family transcriptional regulator [Haploplasma axanthum]|uniref:GntR family transcriptional regulator n=1 Tax=Haploplasma axanthum TaxID=29552 RepID=A0A449BCY7_HAPAX|nr:MurR/RpiR family transcriptional regulator [Haploplasma axanthum]VEU80288.1 GntR family transcriptional regulator [Haploplasma axanthum]